MLKIEVFSAPGCGKCTHAKEMLKDIVLEYAQNLSWCEVDIMQDMDYAVDLGVMSTPAIAIDGQLVFTSLPSKEKLLAEIKRRL
jgi:glutaredoxin